MILTDRSYRIEAKEISIRMMKSPLHGVMWSCVKMKRQIWTQLWLEPSSGNSQEAAIYGNSAKCRFSKNFHVELALIKIPRIASSWGYIRKFLKRQIHFSVKRNFPSRLQDQPSSLLGKEVPNKDKLYGCYEEIPFRVEFPSEPTFPFESY